MTELRRGAVVWAAPDPSVGREQSGRRPAVVASSDAYLELVDRLVIVVPVTTVDRDWPNHVRLEGETGLDSASFAMTEQPRTIDRSRLAGVVGSVDERTMSTISQWLRDFLELPAVRR